MDEIISFIDSNFYILFPKILLLLLLLHEEKFHKERAVKKPKLFAKAKSRWNLIKVPTLCGILQLMIVEINYEDCHA